MTSKTAIENRYKLFYETKEAADCEVKVKDGEIYKTIPAHKLLLGMASPVLYAMLYNERFKESKDLVISLDDIDFATMNIFLRFIYLKDITLETAESALNVFYAAHKYDVKDLENICEEFLIKAVSPENVIQILEFETKIEKPRIREAALKVIAKDTEAMLSSDGFLNATLNILPNILESSELRIKDEGVLYKAIDKYAIYNGYSRTEMDEAIKKIRFLTMSLDEFLDACMQSGLLTSDEKCAIMCNIYRPNDPKCDYPKELSSTKDHHYEYIKRWLKPFLADYRALANFLFSDPSYERGRANLLAVLSEEGFIRFDDYSYPTFLQNIFLKNKQNSIVAIFQFFKLHRIDPSHKFKTSPSQLLPANTRYNHSNYYNY